MNIQRKISLFLLIIVGGLMHASQRPDPALKAQLEKMCEIEWISLHIKPKYMYEHIFREFKYTNKIIAMRESLSRQVGSNDIEALWHGLDLAKNQDIDDLAEAVKDENYYIWCTKLENFIKEEALRRGIDINHIKRITVERKEKDFHSLLDMALFRASNSTELAYRKTTPYYAEYANRRKLLNETAEGINYFQRFQACNQIGNCESCKDFFDAQESFKASEGYRNSVLSEKEKDDYFQYKLQYIKSVQQSFARREGDTDDEAMEYGLNLAWEKSQETEEEERYRQKGYKVVFDIPIPYSSSGAAKKKAYDDVKNIIEQAKTQATKRLKENQEYVELKNKELVMEEVEDMVSQNY